MKKNKFDFLKKFIVIFGLLPVFLFTACSEDEDPIEDPIATFQYEISGENWLEVTFMNFSQNATAYSWNFGDGNSSTEENPTHVYAEAGNYDVTLTASNAAGVSANFSRTITITDPLEALRILVGESSKDWRLIREGIVMGVSETVDAFPAWWSLENDGSRPCSFYQTWTFSEDGTMTFDDGGSMWGDDVVFAGTDLLGVCFEATAANMVNTEGNDVSAWLSGTHLFEYNPSAGTLTLNGLGAWIGLKKVTPLGDVIVPQESVTYNIQITEGQEYDLMEVSVTGDGFYWQFNYVSYHDWANEPDVVEEQEPIEDIETITPTELGHTFESAESFDYLGEIGGGSIITPGVDDPADPDATKVGEFERTDAQFQEAQLRVSPEPKNIIFTEFTTVSIDVYLPSTNTYDPLTKKVIIGFGNMHDDGGNWWQNLIQYESDELALDEWVTVTFDLDNPSFSSTDGETVFDRDNLDMVFIQIGGTDHTSTGVFYVRNLIFE